MLKIMEPNSIKTSTQRTKQEKNERQRKPNRAKLHQNGYKYTNDTHTHSLSTQDITAVYSFVLGSAWLKN